MTTAKKPSRYRLAEFKFVGSSLNFFQLSEYFNSADSGSKYNNRYLGYEWQWDGTNLSWILAPDTQRYWPKLFFSKIDYRQGNATGDARVTWEVSRFQRQLSEVAEAASLNSLSAEVAGAIYRDALAQVRSWWSANPHMIGVHYISSMECALRLIAVTHVIDVIRNELAEEDWQAYLNFVEQHASFIFHRLSLFSSAGNHTIAEATGLVYAGVLFPELKDANGWLRSGSKLLNEELCRQIRDDGGPLEQTTWYLKFITELGLLANKLLAREARTLAAHTLKRLQNAAIFLGSLHHSASISFEYGDSDYGYALIPALNLVSYDDYVKTDICHFDVTGVGIFNLKLETEDAAHVSTMFLTKNLGMAPLFGHGHADCLSVCCAVNGHPLLIDTGTFGYNIDDKWRRYFRSVHAHNTVSINSRDQSEQLSNFQWTEDVHTEVLVEPIKQGNDVYCCFARHFGFQASGAIHYRAILINLLGELLVWDCVTGQQEMDVIANWHFATEVVGNQDCFETKVGGTNVKVKTAAKSAELLHGSEHPLAGWCSEGYGEKHEIDTLRLIERGRGKVSLLTRFIFADSVVSDAWWATHIAKFEKLM